MPDQMPVTPVLILLVLYITFGKSILSSSTEEVGGGAKVAKSINVEVGKNVEGWIFWKKLVQFWIF